MDERVGMSIKGYTFQQAIGSGAFGVVYRATQSILAREVAVKVILPQFTSEPEFIRRFESEAQLVAHLEHPFIVPLFDFWRDPTGAYLVMRYLRGGSLREHIEQEPLPFELSLRMIDQISNALSVAHRQGVIHLDIKPHNIMLDEDHIAYLTDFGIARFRDATKNGDQHDFAGTPGYAAPEMIEGNEPRPTMDIYSLGIMFYEMLTGTHPFGKLPLSQMLYKQFNEDLPDIVGIPYAESLNACIKKMTHKSPDARYRSVQEMLKDLQQWGAPINIAQKSNALIINPYKGLQSFSEADQEDFFGREDLVQDIIARLKSHVDLPYSRFLAIVGPSGSGKSSVVEAGIIPRLRKGALPQSEKWFIVHADPGVSPIDELTEALLKVAIEPPDNLHERLKSDSKALVWAVDQIIGRLNTELLLVIDNFEYLFTLTDNQEDIDQYLALLFHAVTNPKSRVHILMIMRADFYDRPLQYENFGELLQLRTQLVLPMTMGDIRLAITGPATRVGLQVDPEFIAAIIQDVSNQPGELPLLQYALTEAFEFRENNKLTVKSYQLSGGLVGALKRRAEDLYQSLKPHQQELARQIFLRLVSIDSARKYQSRQQVRQTELLGLAKSDAEKQDIQFVLNAFMEYDLLTFDYEIINREPIVEIAHDALIDVWDLFQEWLYRSHEDLLTERWLVAASQEWIDKQFDKSYLATGSRLAQLETWAKDTDLQLTPMEQRFLDASIDEREQLLKIESERQQRELALAQQSALIERNSANRLRRLTGYLMGMIAVLVLLTGGMIFFSSRASEEAEKSRSIALAVSAQTEMDNNHTDLGLALARIAAQGRIVPNVVRRILVQATYMPGTQRIYQGHESSILGLAISHDGQYMLTGSGRYSASQEIAEDNSIRLWRIETGELIRIYEGHTDSVWSLVFSPDDRTFYSASSDSHVYQWDVETGLVLQEFIGHTEDVRAVAMSPDGRLIATGSGRFGDAVTADSDYSVRIWSTEDGQVRCVIREHQSEIRAVAFSPDGRYVASASGAERDSQRDNSIRLWDAETCEGIRRFDGHTDIVQDVVFSPDGRYLLSASADYSAIVWDVESGAIQTQFTEHTDWVNQVSFTADSRYALSGGWDNAIYLWDVQTGIVLYEYLGHRGAIRGIELLPQGNGFISAGQDRVARNWNIENALLISRLYDDEGSFSRRIAFTPDHTALLSANRDNHLVLWSTMPDAQGNYPIIEHFEGQQSAIQYLAISPDSQTFYSGGSSEGELLQWNRGQSTPVRAFIGHTGRVWGVAVSPDGLSLVSGSDDSTVRIWDTTTGTERYVFDEGISEAYAVAFTRDGQQIIAGTLDGEIIVWSATTYEELFRLHDHSFAVWRITVSPDGQYVASGGYDNRIIVWDTRDWSVYRILEGHASVISGLNFADNNRTVISASQDQTVRLWDLASGEELGRVVYSRSMSSMDLSPDGRQLAIGSSNVALALYHLPEIDVSKLLTLTANSRYLYSFSCAERLQYSLEPLCQ